MFKWRVNSILGFIAFLFSFGFSYINNTWQTSLFRAVIGFLLFFLLGALVTIVWNQMISQKNEPLRTNNRAEEEQNLDDKPKKSAEEQGEEHSFQAMSLGALHKGDSESTSGEEVAQAIRTMMNDNGRDSS